MKSKFMLTAYLTTLAFALIAFAAPAAFAQEGELQVVDEVIAQVNEDVITLSMLKRESRERIESLKQNGMTEQQATEEVTKHKMDLIATLVNERLLLQKGKELDLAAEVEAEVNHRMLEVAKDQGIASIEKLDQAMRESGVDPVSTRQTLRTEIMKQFVIQQEVDRKLFLGLTIDELKKYFEAHREKFLKPETITISEIFLSSAGKNDADVKARAMELATQLRAGADFAAVAAANSERESNGVRIAAQTKGKVGRFEMPSLREDIATVIKSVKVGGVSDPLKSTDGYQIFRVDERTPGSTVAIFNENQVREAITIERSTPARDAYLQGLRNDAYISLAKDYQDAVLPLLKISPPSQASNTDSGQKSDKKKNKGKAAKP
ncbi:MAG: peptidylprolyl isomerase [bacterium]